MGLVSHVIVPLRGHSLLDFAPTNAQPSVQCVPFVVLLAWAMILRRLPRVLTRLEKLERAQPISYVGFYKTQPVHLSLICGNPCCLQPCPQLEMPASNRPMRQGRNLFETLQPCDSSCGMPRYRTAERPADGFRSAHPPLLAGDDLLTAAQAGDLAVEGVQVQLTASHFGDLLSYSKVPLQLLKGLEKAHHVSAHSLVLCLCCRIVLAGHV